MQGITVALSPQGIQYFVEGLKSDLETHLSKIQPVDRTFSVPDFTINGGDNNYQSISIVLSKGTMTGFNIQSQSLKQTNSNFQLTLISGSLNTQYNWQESYQERDCHFNFGSGGWECGDWYNGSNSFPSYSPTVSSLTSTIGFQFEFDSNKWVLSVISVDAQAAVSSDNIPANSIVGSQVNSACFLSYVRDTLSASLDAIDLSTPIQSDIGTYLTSIPASGQLFQGPNGTITFAFGLGDSPLTFPDSGGLSVGVTGISTYAPPGGSPKQFPGTPPTGLPVPSTVQPLPLLFGGIPASEAANFDAKNIAAIKTDFATYSPQIQNPPPQSPTPQYPLTSPTVTVVTQGSEWQVFDSSNNNMFQVQLNTQKNTLDVHGLYHLQMYVSDYVLNGLYWAFANAGLLTETVTPAMLQQWGLDPSVLYVSTYYKSIPSTDPLHKALEPYSNSLKKMNALVRPAQGTYEPVIPPRVAFQNVYVFNSNTLTTLQDDTRLVDSTNKNPNWVYDAISGSTITTNAYVDINDLTSDLNDLGIGSPYVQYIASDIQELGALVTHNLELTCTIQDATVPAVNPPPNSPAPYFTFTLTRYDILTDLKLGISKSGKAQTLQFTHTECQPAPTVTMTASNFVPASSFIWLASVWSTVGEFAYSNLLTELGQIGVPLPIMSRFQFLFEEALTNLE
jgi:hypothetical protein